MLLKLKDYGELKISDDVAMKLRRYAGLSLDELQKDNPSFLVFPSCLGDNGDKINEGHLFSLTGDDGYRVIIDGDTLTKRWEVCHHLMVAGTFSIFQNAGRQKISECRQAVQNASGRKGAENGI